MARNGWNTRFIIDAGAHSVVGKVRDHNEDAASIKDDLCLYAVADGLGGHQAGEHASNLAIEMLSYRLAQARDDGEGPSLELLLEAFDRANLGILDDAATHPERTGMGTTLTAIVITGSQLLLAHVGDSRAWRVRDGVVEQLTQDHTVVAQQVRDGVITEDDAVQHPMRHILSRCLGLREEIEVDLVECDVAYDDVYILASDGLVPGIEFEDMVELTAAGADASIAAQMLVDRACERDGQDNITAVVVVCREE